MPPTYTSGYEREPEREPRTAYEMRPLVKATQRITVYCMLAVQPYIFQVKEDFI